MVWLHLAFPHISVCDYCVSRFTGIKKANNKLGVTSKIGSVLGKGLDAVTKVAGGNKNTASKN